MQQLEEVVQMDLLQVARHQGGQRPVEEILKQVTVRQLMMEQQLPVEGDSRVMKTRIPKLMDFSRTILLRMSFQRLRKVHLSVSSHVA